MARRITSAVSLLRALSMLSTPNTFSRFPSAPLPLGARLEWITKNNRSVETMAQQDDSTAALPFPFQTTRGLVEWCNIWGKLFDSFVFAQFPFPWLPLAVTTTTTLPFGLAFSIKLQIDGKKSTSPVVRSVGFFRTVRVRCVSQHLGQVCLGGVKPFASYCLLWPTIATHL